MCELLGVSSARSIRVNGLLREFFSHSDKHPNGWGLAAFYSGVPSIEKEPVQASRSAYLKARLDHPLEVPALLAHIRFATVGSMEYGNCHPFFMRDAGGRGWTLIHNGTIFDYPALSPYQYLQEGGTDSERILLYLVDQINRKRADLGREPEAEERAALLEPLIADMAQGNKLNLILYDGTYMYVHTNYANSLYVCEDGTTALFCTVPLKRGRWEPVPFTALCVYRDGRRVYQGRPHGREYVENEKDLRYLFAAFAGL